jgi:hypothetical protein
MLCFLHSVIRSRHLFAVEISCREQKLLFVERLDPLVEKLD